MRRWSADYGQKVEGNGERGKGQTRDASRAFQKDTPGAEFKARRCATYVAWLSLTAALLDTRDMYKRHCGVSGIL
jgi:hypothetical protein